MQKESLVSIIIPTYNRALIISETLDCILKQTYFNWECIIVDDQSSDETNEVITRYVDKDKRFRYFLRDVTFQKGASSCRNIGLEKSRGNYIQFLDSDDLISPDKIKYQIQLLINSNNEYTISTCKWGGLNNSQIEMFENLPAYKSFENIPKFLKALTQSKGYFPIHAYLIPKSLINKSGNWNEELTLNDDGEFIIRLLSFTDRILFCNTSFVLYRKGTDNNLSSFKNKSNISSSIKSWDLIEKTLKLRFGKKTDAYINWNKQKLFINVNNHFPKLINDHQDFFSIQLNNQRIKKLIFYRLLIKIKKIVK
jgi:glycosyltransferase involved in cell wall biosynthesis